MFCKSYQLWQIQFFPVIIVEFMLVCIVLQLLLNVMQVFFH